MAFPRNLAEMLRQHRSITANRTLTTNYACQGAKFHSPTPLEVHLVTVNRKSVYLCGVCRDNLALLIDLTEAVEKPLKWAVLREFGAGIRNLLRERTTTDG
jgi:hypothetical protein